MHAMATQLDIFTPTGGRRPMRLAPDVVRCQECGGGCFSCVVENDETHDEVATVCNQCHALYAKTARDRRRAEELIRTYGLTAACCYCPPHSPRVPLPSLQQPSSRDLVRCPSCGHARFVLAPSLMYNARPGDRAIYCKRCGGLHTSYRAGQVPSQGVVYTEDPIPESELVPSDSGEAARMRSRPA